MNASKTRDDYNQRYGEKDLIEQYQKGIQEGKLAFAKVSSNYSIGYKDGRVSTIKEVLEIIDKCPDIPIPQHCSKKMLKAKLEKQLGGKK
jgi:hypothetical protein